MVVMRGRYAGGDSGGAGGVVSAGGGVVADGVVVKWAVCAW